MEFFFGALLALFFLRDEPAPPPRPVAEEFVILVPGSDEHIGALVVERGGRRQVLDKPYAVSRIRSGGVPVEERLSEEFVRREYAALLAALPAVSEELVVVIPDDTDRHIGVVAVERAGMTLVLDKAYAASRVRSQGAPEADYLNEAQVQREFGDLLAALPSLTEEIVVVIPADYDGHIGSVVVEHAGVRRILDQAYAASHIRSMGPAEVEQFSREMIDGIFPGTLAAMPQAPAKYLLYFVLGTDDLTADSAVELRKVLTEIASRPVPDVLVVGHTDTMGGATVNDRLSLQRAERVKDIMTKAGIDADRIEISGRGSRELLIPTDIEVDEPRNRRVEINVR